MVANYPVDPLFERIQQDDTVAFRLVYERYWRRLWGIAVAKSKSEQVAEDLIQSLFLKLWERRKELEIHNVEAYLMTALKYALISHIRSLLIRRFEQIELHTDKMVQQPHFEGEEVMLLIEKALTKLPDKTQHIFRLSRFEELSHKEIAHQLNLSEKAVEYHISQALKSLRIQLKDYLLLWLIAEYVMS